SANIIKAEFEGILSESKTIFVVTDNDPAGKVARAKLRSNFRRLHLVDVRLPKEAKDVNDYFVKLGKTKADFDALVGAALASAVVPHAAPAPMLKRSVTSTPVAAAIAALRVSPEGFLLSPLKRICPSLDVVGNSAYMA